METNQKSVFMVAGVHGALIGCGLVAYSIILWMLDLSLVQALGYVSYLILIVGIVLSLKNYRDSVLGGFMTYGQGLGLGVLNSFVAAVIAAVFSYIFLMYIDTEFINKIVELSEQKMIEQGIPEEQLGPALEIQKKFMTPLFMSGISVITTTLGGFIFSLIIAAIFKKQPDVFKDTI